MQLLKRHDQVQEVSKYITLYLVFSHAMVILTVIQITISSKSHNHTQQIVLSSNGLSLQVVKTKTQETIGYNSALLELQGEIQYLIKLAAIPIPNPIEDDCCQIFY